MHRRTCKWLDPCPFTGRRHLQISTALDTPHPTITAYYVEPRMGGFDLYRYDTTLETLVVRHIDTTWPKDVWTCDCPDAVHRSRTGCKHVLALKAALARDTF